ncbi:hypothetical protein Q7C36_007296 [Tachysurus vachellii]|uniref:Uncharacterized protein n=1 Tax=Tachysurus vachellii TaxID=175792 RepID=A0AA88NAT6_TACVA|nr:hypothetical protein Q7C36_007296 [Tachysurus vachellii]
MFRTDIVRVLSKNVYSTRQICLIHRVILIHIQTVEKTPPLPRPQASSELLPSNRYKRTGLQFVQSEGAC